MDPVVVVVRETTTYQQVREALRDFPIAGIELDSTGILSVRFRDDATTAEREKVRGVLHSRFWQPKHEVVLTPSVPYADLILEGIVDELPVVIEVLSGGQLRISSDDFRLLNSVIDEFRAQTSRPLVPYTV